MLADVYIKMFDVGIIGGGFVGRATSLLENENIKVSIYDTDKSRCVPESTTLDDIIKKEIVFICVPTPCYETTKECDTSIVENVIKELRANDYNGFIVVRSTVSIGFCKEWKVYFMPEFLTEKNWELDFINCKSWIVGSEGDERFIDYMTQLLRSSSVLNGDKVDFVTTDTAEYIKYFRNCFLSVKVSFANEMYDLANKLNIDYNSAKDLVSLDDRIGPSHLSVPGPDGYRGFGGHCFPKDMNSLRCQFFKNGIRCDVISAAIKRNIELDRGFRD